MHRRQDPIEPQESSRPSKSALKRAMHDLQDLGEALVELSPAQFEKIDMPQPLRDAIEELRRTRSHEGRRRQLQYVGKVMRQVDPEPLREAVAAARLGHARDTLALHEAERWRDRLVEDDRALAEWIQAHPGTDAQQIRALIRNARRDAAATEPGPTAGTAPRKGRAYRELFQLLRDELQREAKAATAADADADASDDTEPDDE